MMLVQKILHYQVAQLMNKTPSYFDSKGIRFITILTRETVLTHGLFEIFNTVGKNIYCF